MNAKKKLNQLQKFLKKLLKQFVKALRMRLIPELIMIKFWY